MKTSFIIPAIAVAMLASCTSEEEDHEIDKKYTGNVEITTEPFVLEESKIILKKSVIPLVKIDDRFIIRN